MANIVDTAVSAGTFKTLVAAVTAAGLAPTLSGPGPFTGKLFSQICIRLYMLHELIKMNSLNELIKMNSYLIFSFCSY